MPALFGIAGLVFFYHLMRTPSRTGRLLYCILAVLYFFLAIMLAWANQWTLNLEG